MQLTQKERLLLEDQKSHEEMCIKKYTEASNKAQDPQLKQMFQQHAQQEQQHLNTINAILSGQVPAMQSGQQSGGQQGQSGMQSGQQSGQGMQNQGAQQGQGIKQIQNQVSSGNNNQQDKDLCQDLLMTEKYVSGAYDTTIFECTDTNVRQALNHIQKEEQQHGEDIFNYMQANGMYTPQ